jgi:hypothetical protein
VAPEEIAWENNFPGFPNIDILIHMHCITPACLPVPDAKVELLVMKLNHMLVTNSK